MGKNRLPEGYKSAAQLLKEFREKNPEGIITTSALVSNGDYVVVTATVKVGSLTATGIADADLQEGKGSSKAESAAIRRALVHLGFDSVEADDSDEPEEKPRQEEKRSFKRDLPKKDLRSESAKDADDDEAEEKEETPRSRFASNKAAAKPVDEDDADEETEEKPKFERGSRFKRG